MRTRTLNKFVVVTEYTEYYAQVVTAVSSEDAKAIMESSLNKNQEKVFAVVEVLDGN